MLGQSKFPYAVSEIFSLLKHEDFSVRASAASALGCIKGDFSVNSLLEALNDPHRDVRRNSVVSLGKVGETRVIPFLLDALASDDKFMQEKALSSIQRLSNSNKNILPILLNNISSEYSFIRMSIAKIIGHSRNSVYLPKLLELSLDPSHEVRKSVAVALSNMEKTDEIIHTLKQLILDSDSGVCGQALIALANVCGEDAFDTITANFQRPEEFIRGSCAIASGSLSQLQALKLLTKNINDEHAYVRGSIASSLGKFPSWESAEGLLHYLKDPHEYVRGNASEGLSNFQDYFVGDSLVECCHDPHHYVRAKSVISLGTIGHLKAKSIILSMLSLDDHEYARGNAAISISYIYVDNEVIDALLLAICDISKHVYSHAAQALVDNANDFPEILGKLAAQLHLSPGKSIFRAVKGIQSSCKFYNYEIEQQAKLRKADRASLGDGGDDRSLPATITYNVIKELNLVSEQQPIFNQYNPTIGVNYAAANSNPKIIQNTHQESQDTSLLAIVQIIQALEKRNTHVQNPQQAIDIIDAEFKSLEASRSPQWQNLLNVKRLYNGGKKAAVKVSEHFAQENVWGKGFVAFLEGVSEDVK
jgi:HEAT repeat protein